MNARQRIITALKKGVPDRVPVTLSLSEMVPVRKSGLSYIDYFYNEKRDLVKDRCDVESFFGGDVFLHSSEGPAPDDPEISVETLKKSREEVIFREVIHTRRGKLEAVKRITVNESPAILEGFVKNPEEDAPRVLETLQNPETKNFGGYLDHRQYVGDLGHCGFWLPTPFDWWSILRRSPETAIYDLFDHGRLMDSLFSEYSSYAESLIAALLRGFADKVDSIGLGGSSTSMSVISPDILERYIAPFVRRVKSAASARGVPVQYHMCGRSREAIPVLVDAGVDGMDALERGPSGNVDLGEVKEVFGGRISLRGNVNSIEVMLHGGPGDVEKDVVRCMEQAKDGGGFILGVGDQVPYRTPDENIFALAEAGIRHGSY